MKALTHKIYLFLKPALDYHHDQVVHYLHYMIKSPYISATLEKEHPGEVVISLNGKILGIGENTIIAVENAKKIMPDIEEKEFLVSRISNGLIRI